MSMCKTVDISESVRFNSFTDARFKTMRISINMFIPLEKSTASQYGILPALVTRATQEFPDYTSLSQRLSELYGASLSSGVRTIGDYQVLRVAVGGISSRYAFDGENMFKELSQLLFSILEMPLKDADGYFPQDGFLQEQRQILELKETEFNDKIAYAHRRCKELLFRGEAPEIDRYGSREQVQNLQREPLAQAWTTLLHNARFEIFVLGDCTPDVSMIKRYFHGFGSPRTLSFLPYNKPDAVRRETETLPVAQSKLSLGFRVNCKAEKRILYQLMSAVFGGTPTSKLFANVREKMSLCYYCSSSFDAANRALFVDSGVETENIEKAESEILHQLSLLQKGILSEEELTSAKLALRNSMQSVSDSLSSVESWCISHAFESEGDKAPEEAVQELMSYTAEEVCQAAHDVELAAVFCLRGNAE